ncbi:MAG: hypothetical protein WCG92_05525 [Hyphomicrobiales bacterium]
MAPWKTILAATVTASLLMPVVNADAATGQRKSAKVTVYPKKRAWHGYGYLPGYRPSLAETNGLPVLGPDPRRKREYRYYSWYDGQPRYSWGRPGFYRGQWNGGGFGPCWTSTPIGMMPTCGQ